MRLLLLLALLCSSAVAQDARLVLRDAVVLEPSGYSRHDTTGMVAVAHGEQTVYLGDVLMALGEGTVTSAGLDVDPYTNEPTISVAFSPSAAEAFEDLTGTRIGRALAVVLDGEVLIAPSINQQVTGGRLQISGRFSWDEARAIVASILEATGAADLRRARLAAARQQFDRSTPESTVASFSAATAATDGLTMLRLLHPSVLQELRGEERLTFEVRGDSVRVLPGDRPATDWVSAADVLDRPMPAEGVDALTDPEIVALTWWAAGGGIRFSLQAFTPIGSVRDDDGIVHVVTRPAQTDVEERTSEGFGDAHVISVQQVDGEWVVLVPVDGW